MPLPDSFLDELRARTPLHSLVGGRVRLIGQGRDRKGLCPFHSEKSPSFHCYDDHFHCFGCGAHGDAIGFVMRLDNLPFLEAVERLAGEAGLSVPRDPRGAAEAERQAGLSDIAQAMTERMTRRLFDTEEGAPALAYLRNRGLTDETIRGFGLGWSGQGRGTLAAMLASLPDGAGPAELLLDLGLAKPRDEGGSPVELFFGRVMFPIRDPRGRVIAWGGRTLGDGQPKYLNSPETERFQKRRTLYGLDRATPAARRGSEVVVVEGYMDVIALHQAGFDGAVAPLGTALTAEQLEALWKLAPAPVLCFDGDAAGSRAAAKAVATALPLLGPGRSLRFATLPSGQDPDSLVRARGRTAFEAVLAAAEPLVDRGFASLVAGRPSATPEARAAIRAELFRAAALIPDKGLAGDYRRTWGDRFFSEIEARGRRRFGPSGSQTGSETRFVPGQPRRGLRPSQPRPIPDAGRARSLRGRDLLFLLLAHPVLLPEVEEVLGHLDLPLALEPLRAILLADPVGFAGLDPEATLDHVRLSGGAMALEAALGLSDLPPLRLPDLADAEALAVWSELAAGISPEALGLEIELARERLAGDCSDGNERRLVALKRLQARAGMLSSMAEDETAEPSEAQPHQG